MEKTWPFSEPTNDISNLVETALGQRPELLSLRNQQSAADSFAKSQRDSRLPKIEAVGVAGGAPTHDSHLPDNYAAAGVQLSLPLFAGGYYVARQHEAELKAQSDAELLRAAENSIIRDVHLAWLNLSEAKEQVTTTKQLVAHAAEAFDLAEARYKIGSSSIIELSQAQLSLTTAQISEANAHYNLLMQMANLNYQIGALH